LRRNAVAIHQDLVDTHGFTGAYNTVKRFVAKLRWERTRGKIWKLAYGVKNCLIRTPCVYISTACAPWWINPLPAP